MFWNCPRVMMIELTNMCNLKCKMCGIWAERPHINIPLDQYQSVLEEKVCRWLRLISLTGGEPFLLKDFEQYYQIARKTHPRAHINISSNGQCKGRTVEFFSKEKVKNTSITISYDGIRSHDSIRGVKGSGEKLIETAIKIKEIAPQVSLSLKLTITNENYSELLDTAKQCKEIGVPFRFKTLEKLNCHQSRSPSEIDGPDYSNDIMNSINEQAREILKLGIDTNKKYIQSLISKNEGADCRCNCCEKTIFMGVDGKVFLCRKKEPIGNFYQQPLTQIWESTTKNEVINEMKICKGSPVGMSFIHQ